VADTAEKVFLSAYLNTAARRSEVFSWKWSEDIDSKNRRVRLTTEKTKTGLPESVWLPMNDDLYGDLMRWCEHRPIKDTPYVFVSSSNRHYGKPYTTRRRFLNGLCKRAGVKAFQFHALRRYVASVLAQTHNVSILSIQRVLRHKNLSTTELYVQDINRDMRGVLDLLGEKVPMKSAH
jgi:integrase